MTTTPNLDLPFIEGAQAQKHVTHNEALSRLDAVVMLSVLDRDAAVPPVAPQEGDRFIVKAPGLDEFSGHDHKVAYYATGGWSFLEPRPGWLCHVEDENALVVWNGSVWQSAVISLQDLELLGIGTSADAVNPLAAKLNKTLWTAKAVSEGGTGDLRFTLNKEASANTLSLLMQTAYSGRVEIGLAGDDDLRFKVSSDGSSWLDALRIDRSSGAVTFGDVEIGSRMSLSGVLAPAQITADQNDYAPPGFSTAAVLRISADAARAVTGLAGGTPGRVVALVNIGSHAITLANAHAGSAAANRFSIGTNAVIVAGRSALVWYDTADSRWRLLALS